MNFNVWGRDGIDGNTIEQMQFAMNLPITTAGSLMPDAHLGYGLPIGGVWATRQSVVPMAVGVDIACRMKLTVWDIQPEDLHVERAKQILQANTRFGVGSNWDDPRDHDVMYDDWAVSPVTLQNKSRAQSQLGTSGSGNHFAEFGEVDSAGWDGVPEGRFLALLTHSGSRGTGAAVCAYYSKLAKEQHPEGGDLAWLDLDSDAGREYWDAMTLMGRYAEANHAIIHSAITAALGAPKIVMGVENHHNFAWKEVHNGEEVIVHRKGATPAGKGVLGVIPGTMSDPAYIVEGKGNPDSLDSASHGAGRKMSRTNAKKLLDKDEQRAILEAKGVTLVQAGHDEFPGAYKDIREVMRAQRDLVQPLATFTPKVVLMAAGGRAED